MARYLWALAVLPFLALVLLTGGCGATSPIDAAQDSPTVVLHGYTFGSSSNTLTHPWFAARPSSPKLRLAGWGSLSRKAPFTITFGSGPTIRGIKTLRMAVEGLGHPEAPCVAQDMLGNIHMLQVLDNGKPTLRGIAANEPAWFFLPQPSEITPGKTWGWVHEGRRRSQERILSVRATFRGRSRLLRMQEIIDGNGDQHFDPSWSGPDQRADVYFQSGGYCALQVSATGGYSR